MNLSTASSVIARMMSSPSSARMRRHAPMRANRSAISSRRILLMPHDLGSGETSIREGPGPQLLLRRRPEAREAMRLERQEQDDQRAGDHERQLLDGRRRHMEPD